MHRLLALYGMPTDPEQFRRHYESTHIPLGRRIPGLKGLRWSLNVQGLGGESPYFCIAELDFESAEAMQAGFASDEGQATAADSPNFATGGVTVVHYDVPD
jgi:uncharacterized protein (TIGR02118 family)